jgi:hypothetical protein
MGNRYKGARHLPLLAFASRSEPAIRRLGLTIGMACRHPYTSAAGPGFHPAPPLVLDFFRVSLVFLVPKCKLKWLVPFHLNLGPISRNPCPSPMNSAFHISSYRRTCHSVRVLHAHCTVLLHSRYFRWVSLPGLHLLVKTPSIKSYSKQK